MEEAAKKLNMKLLVKYLQIETMKMMAILVSRKKPHALITDPEQAKKHV